MGQKKKPLWEKEKMLVTSIFSFSHNVFKRLLFQHHLMLGLCGKGLNPLFSSVGLICIKVPIAANKKEFVYKIKANPIHTILKYGDYHDLMDR